MPPVPPLGAGHSLRDRALPTGALAGAPKVTSDVARLRRRNVLLGLIGLAVLTLLLGLSTGGIMLAIHALVDVVLGVYVLMLVQYQREVDHARNPYVPAYAADPAPRHLAPTGTDNAHF